MDPSFWRSVCYVVVFLGATLVVTGTIGTYYFGARMEATAPYRQSVKTATAAVEIAVESDSKISTEFLDKGATADLSKDGEILLRMSSVSSSATQSGSGQVVYRAELVMNPADPGLGKSVQALKTTDTFRVFFQKMPAESKILTGRISILINGEVPIEVSVPPQQISDGLIAVRDVASVFAHFQ
jgi:hypothetical protein